MNPNRSSKCAGKHRHPSEGAAAAQIRSMAARLGDDPAALRAYPCPWCKGWHVGHVPPDQFAHRKKGKR